MLVELEWSGMESNLRMKVFRNLGEMDNYRSVRSADAKRSEREFIAQLSFTNRRRPSELDRPVPR
jgi:hypothetical protein